jgi:hypothetical protein
VEGEPERIRFSFQYLDTTHPSFSIVRCDRAYFRLLLARLRDLSALRVHRINFNDPRLSVRSFGIRGMDADEKAWQFALSANEHGRVHGFLEEGVFFIRWLDPEHNLYPGN